MLTRKDDTFVDLAERPQRAAKAGADLFLAIHFNAGPPSVSGIETYRLTPQHLRSTASEKLTPDDDDAVPGNSVGCLEHLAGFQYSPATPARRRPLRPGTQARALRRHSRSRDLSRRAWSSAAISAKRRGKIDRRAGPSRTIAAAIAAGVDAYAALFNPPNVHAAPSTAFERPRRPAAPSAPRVPDHRRGRSPGNPAEDEDLCCSPRVRGGSRRSCAGLQERGSGVLGRMKLDG